MRYLASMQKMINEIVLGEPMRLALDQNALNQKLSEYYRIIVDDVIPNRHLLDDPDILVTEAAQSINIHITVSVYKLYWAWILDIYKIDSKKNIFSVYFKVTKDSEEPAFHTSIQEMFGYRILFAYSSYSNIGLLYKNGLGIMECAYYIFAMQQAFNKLLKHYKKLVSR